LRTWPFIMTFESAVPSTTTGSIQSGEKCGNACASVDSPPAWARQWARGSMCHLPFKSLCRMSFLARCLSASNS
jgi:hypothetical protein